MPAHASSTTPHSVSSSATASSCSTYASSLSGMDFWPTNFHMICKYCAQARASVQSNDRDGLRRAIFSLLKRSRRWHSRVS